MFPFGDGTQFVVYDPVTHTIRLEEDATLAHAASFVNAAKITTYTRTGPEQYHGAVKGTNKVLIPSIIVTTVTTTATVTNKTYKPLPQFSPMQPLSDIQKEVDSPSMSIFKHYLNPIDIIQ